MTPFHCRSCHQEIGRTDGRRLVMGVHVGGRFISAGAIYRRVAIECPICDKMTVWQPVARHATMQIEQGVAA